MTVFNKMDLSAVLLAGGDSTRMGTNKAFLKLNNVNLVDLIFEKLAGIFKEVLIVTDKNSSFQHLEAKVVSDLVTLGKKNALRGIHSGLMYASSDASFLVACDMPFISKPLICHMATYALEYDLVIPRIGGHYQPLFAFYHRRVLKPVTRALQEEHYKITGFYAGLKLKEISEDTVKRYDPEMLSFININTPQDYARAKKLFKKE